MPENKFEPFPINSDNDQEKELSPEEAEQLKTDMGEYIFGLRNCIEEIRGKIERVESEEEKEKLRKELEEIEEQALGLEDFSGAINEAESIKINPYEGK